MVVVVDAVIVDKIVVVICDDVLAEEAVDDAAFDEVGAPVVAVLEGLVEALADVNVGPTEPVVETGLTIAELEAELREAKVEEAVPAPVVCVCGSDDKPVVTG